MSGNEELSGAALKNEFDACEQLVREHRVHVPESAEMRIYGLDKQIKLGNCSQPKPPSSNILLSAKWEAWVGCQGIAVDTAMKEYISIVRTLEPATARSTMPTTPSDGRRLSMSSTSNVPSLLAPTTDGNTKKSGVLFKQRDLFKGWRARHFTLQDNFLHYYLEAEDSLPRNSLDLTGCNVTSQKVVNVDGVDYYPFAITHPGSKPFNLAASSKLEADVWIARILEAASAPVVEVTSSSGDLSSSVDGSSGATRRQSIALPSGGFSAENTTNVTETLAGLSTDLHARVEKSVKGLVDKLSPEMGGWEPLFDKDGVVAKKRSGAIMCVKGETNLAFNLVDVFSVIMDARLQISLDPQRLQHDQIRRYSTHTAVDYLRFKGTWPTSPRDFVSLVHWRLLTDGRVVITSSAIKDELKGDVDGHVRGETLLGGFVLTPTASGTRVGYLVETDLKGTLPASVVNLAANSQPMLLIALRKMMEKDRAKYNRSFTAPTTYSDLLAVIANTFAAGQATPASNTASTSAPASATSTASAAPVVTTNTAAVAAAAEKSRIPVHRRATMLKTASRQPKINATALTILFLPAVLYFLVEDRLKLIAFVAGLVIAVTYLLRLHLGDPEKRGEGYFQRSLPSGRNVYRFPVELGHLLQFLEKKRTDSELEITFTHMAVKAVAAALSEYRQLNGHVVGGRFYRSRTPGADVSVSFNASDSLSVAYRVDDADAKPIEWLADELITQAKNMRTGGLKEHPAILRISSQLPTFLSQGLKYLLLQLGSKFGVSIPALGVTAYPYGVAMVVASPNIDGENDIDISAMPFESGCPPPFVVTLGGVRILPRVDSSGTGGSSERRVQGTPVLNFSVTIDSRAASLTEGRKFCSRVQAFLNDPNSLEKVDLRAAFEREEAAKRRQYFGAK